MTSSLEIVVLAAAALLPGEASAQSYTFATIDPNQAYYTIIPWGINGSGTISGVWVDSAQVDHGFTFAGGTFTSFDVPGADTVKAIGIRGTDATGINDAGTIVGGYTAGGVLHGFIRDSGGTVSTVDVVGHLSTGLSDINNAGQIVGLSWDTASLTPYQSFLRSASGTVASIAFPGSTLTGIEGINNLGDTVGTWVDAANTTHGFVRNPAGVYTSLDIAGANLTLPSDINDAGTIVGEVDDASGSHAFVRDASGQVTTFDVPGAAFTSGIGIGANGAVIGQYCDVASTCHGFLATPVPEPSSWALMLGGLIVVRLRRSCNPG